MVATCELMKIMVSVQGRTGTTRTNCKYHDNVDLPNFDGALLLVVGLIVYHHTRKARLKSEPLLFGECMYDEDIAKRDDFDHIADLSCFF